MGLLINIEAIDRGGKTTQARAVALALEARGLRVAMMSFPDTPSRAKMPTPAHFSTGILIERDLDSALPMIDLRDTLFGSRESATCRFISRRSWSPISLRSWSRSSTASTGENGPTSCEKLWPTTTWSWWVAISRLGPTE